MEQTYYATKKLSDVSEITKVICLSTRTYPRAYIELFLKKKKNVIALWSNSGTYLDNKKQKKNMRIIDSALQGAGEKGGFFLNLKKKFKTSPLIFFSAERKPENLFVGIFHDILPQLIKAKLKYLKPRSVSAVAKYTTAKVHKYPETYISH